MDKSAEEVLQFIAEKQGDEFASPRSLFKTGVDESFSFYTSEDELVIVTQDSQELSFPIGMITEAVLFLESKNFASINVRISENAPASMEEHLELWLSGTTNIKFDKNVIPYITDILVISGFAAYGFAKTAGGEKFEAIALKNASPHQVTKSSSPLPQQTQQTQQEQIQTPASPASPAPSPVHEVQNRHSGEYNSSAQTGYSAVNNRYDYNRSSALAENAHLGSAAVLITYSPADGDISETAWAIRNTFIDAGLSVDVKTVQNVDDVRKYGLVILGSPVYNGKMLPEVIDFANLHTNWLLKRMTALFLEGEEFINLDDEKIFASHRIHDKLKKPMNPAAVGLFPGKVNAESLTFKERLLEKDRIGDYRDWRLVGEWADNLKNMYLSRMPRN